MTKEDARARAEAVFKRKEQARGEAERVMAQYKAEQLAIREKTARLRALRLSREEARKKTVVRAAASSA